MSRPRILIVDDDEQIRFVAARALEEIGTCDTARDVDEAVRVLQRQTYDLVLVDVTLPGPSGMTLLDHLRTRWPHTAAVMLSALTELSVAREALDRGALGYVVKPFRVPDLRIQVTAALSSVRRSSGAARASARARIVAQLAALIARPEPPACVVVDLEHVSILKATFGTNAVEELLLCVERRLSDVDPAIELLGQLDPTVFVAALDLPQSRNGSQAAGAVHRILAAPAVIAGQRIPIAARLGVAVVSPEESADSVLNLAESAATAARDGGSAFVVYDGDLRDSARLQLELLADATTAIDRGHLHVVYQSQRELADGQCVGVEALARWRHPTRGDIPASVFIPLAERMDLIEELGACVLRTACRDIAALRRNPTGSDIRVSVNVSTAELRNPDYVTRVAATMGAAKIPASALRLEVTESVALDESVEIEDALTGLQALGVRLSVDDFGTGYASFANLARLPWAEIKLDRSLTTQCHDRRGRELLRAILTYGSALDVDVIAEGIETTEELGALRDLGCRYGQGFLLGRPGPLATISRSLDPAAA